MGKEANSKEMKCEYHKMIAGTSCKHEATKKMGELMPNDKIKTTWLCNDHFKVMVLQNEGRIKAMRTSSVREVLGEE